MMPNSHRRTFLLGTLAATSTISAFARDDQPVRIAIVGTGGRGSDLIRALTTIDDALIVGICDDYAPHLAKATAYAGANVKTFDQYDAMLKELKPDAVVIATPLHLHHDMIIKALDAKCAVFCEKTLCRTNDDARHIVQEVEKRKAIFQIGLQRRSNPIYKQAVAMVESGMLGRVVAIKAQWHRQNAWRRPIPVPRTDAQYQALEKKLNWRLYQEYSGGLMTELGSHQLDVANWILGTLPTRVLATGGIDYWRDGRDVMDNVFCIYEYRITPKPVKDKPNDPYTVRVTYSSMHNNAFEGASELIMGTQGTLVLTQKKGLFYKETGPEQAAGIRTGKAGDDAAVITSGATLKIDNDPWAFRGKPYEIDAESDDTRDELVSFLRSVKAGNPKTVADVRLAFEDCRTVLMANESMKSGKSVDYAS